MKKGLQERFIEFNRKYRLATSKQRTLLTVSGGVDSVVMAHLFKQVGLPFSIAHCNFMLRGTESSEDEVFVRELASMHEVPFYAKRFDTNALAETSKQSIQMVARDIRYQWFNQLVADRENGLNRIATAHHLSDNTETVILNLVRGTGIKGLRGIPVKNGIVIRPLMFATKDEILQYAADHNLNFREDSSNTKDNYARNKLRIHVIPLLKELNPSFEETLASEIEMFKELEDLYDKRISYYKRRLVQEESNKVFISLAGLKHLSNSESVLYNLISGYGFTSTQVSNMISSIDAQPGIEFVSDTHRIIKDRKHYVMLRLGQYLNDYYKADKDTTQLALGNQLFRFTKHAIGDVQITKDKYTAFLDLAKIEFPLLLRKWRAGDYFYPFGMEMKKKKLKKYFTDAKVPVAEKENALVIQSGDKIVWACGMRIDERFKVTEKTKEILKISMSIRESKQSA